MAFSCTKADESLPPPITKDSFPAVHADIASSEWFGGHSGLNRSFYSSIPSTQTAIGSLLRREYCRPKDPFDKWELRVPEGGEFSLLAGLSLERPVFTDTDVERKEPSKESHPAIREMPLADSYHERDRHGGKTRAELQPRVSEVSCEVVNDFEKSQENARNSCPMAVDVVDLPEGQRSDLKDLKCTSEEVLRELDEPKMQRTTRNLSVMSEIEPETTGKSLEAEDLRETSDELEAFLRELSNSEASFPSSLQSDAIRHDVEKMTSRVCDNLRENYRMFQNCKLLRTGSIYEGVKIGKPDEFDFMIELPSLADDSILQFSQNKLCLSSQLVDYEVKNSAFFSDLYTPAQGDGENKDEGDHEKDFMAKIRNEVENKVKEQLQNDDCILPGWELVIFPTLNAYTLPHMAITPILLWKGGEEQEDLYVSIDLSFAIPLKKKPLWTSPFQGGYLGLPVQEKGKLEVSLPDSDEVVHVLLRDSETCRLSFSCQEQEIMKSLNLCSGEKQCFRLVKCLRDSLTSLVFDSDLQQLKPCISTYWLKTIMYYQLKKHKDNPQAWVDSKLGERVLEVFRVLHACLESSTLHSFFIPGYNLLFLKAEEKLQIVREDIDKVITFLCDLKEGHTTRQQVRQEMSTKIGSNAQILYQERREHLMNLFYIYAYNDYDAEDLETIKTAYLQRFFQGKMAVFGDGKKLSLHETGHEVDIDFELEQMHGEKFSYFKG